MTDISIKIIDALKESIGAASEPVSLHEPYIDSTDNNFVEECLKSGWVSSVGSYVNEFEHLLEKKTGAKYAIAVGTGTAALHTALILAGVKAGEEVLVPSLTFVASANAISYCQAIPHFVDSDPDRLCVDPESLESYLEHKILDTKNGPINKDTGRIVRALLPVHVLGIPADMNYLLKIAERFKITVVEDAAESLGSFIGDTHTGNFGLAGALSFNGNKIITTGGGGAIITNNGDLAEQAKHITTTARVDSDIYFTHDQVGFNYRMPNLNAALGCSQIKKLDKLIRQKNKLRDIFKNYFSKINEVQLVKTPSECVSNNWLNGLLIRNSSIQIRNEIIKATNSRNYMTRPAWTPMHYLNMYKKCPRMSLTGAEKIYESLICLPSSAKLVQPE